MNIFFKRKNKDIKKRIKIDEKYKEPTKKEYIKNLTIINILLPIYIMIFLYSAFYLLTYKNDRLQGFITKQVTIQDNKLQTIYELEDENNNITLLFDLKNNYENILLVKNAKVLMYYNKKNIKDYKIHKDTILYFILIVLLYLIIENSNKRKVLKNKIFKS